MHHLVIMSANPIKMHSKISQEYVDHILYYWPRRDDNIWVNCPGKRILHGFGAHDNEVSRAEMYVLLAHHEELTT